MSEADITFHMSEGLNRLWSIQQWWASISIGVLIMAHLAAARLNTLLIGISLFLYTAYTAFMLQTVAEITDTLAALAGDLRLMLEAGSVSSGYAREMVEIPDFNPTLYNITFGGTYFAAVFYLLYAYVRSRGERGEGSSHR